MLQINFLLMMVRNYHEINSFIKNRRDLIMAKEKFDRSKEHANIGTIGPR